MRGKVFKASDPCVYCGAPSKPGKGDHVITQGFFPTGSHSAGYVPICVPACEKCNCKFSADEEYAIHTITMDYRCQENQRAVAVFNERCVPGFVRSKGKLKKIIGDGGRTVDVRTRGGVIREDHKAITIDHHRIERVIDKIIRGLHYHEFGQRVPDGSSIVIRINNDLQVFESAAFRQFVNSTSGERVIDDGQVFRYICCEATDKPGASAWAMVFYCAYPVLAWVFPPGQTRSQIAYVETIAHIWRPGDL